MVSYQNPGFVIKMRAFFNCDVSRIQRSFWGQAFEAFATGICVLDVQNMVPELLRIGPILSVCVCVCVCVRVCVLSAFFSTKKSVSSKTMLIWRVMATGSIPCYPHRNFASGGISGHDVRKFRKMFVPNLRQTISFSSKLCLFEFV